MMQSDAQTAGTSQSSTILIVDDKITNIQLLALLLEGQGYSVTYALNAQDALKRLAVTYPDLILLDLFMPGVNGLELLKMIRAESEFQDIPVIFLTASHNEEHLVEAFKLGAADYMTKPFRASEVLVRAATHIKLKQQTLQLKYANDKLNTIVTHVQDGLLVVDQQGIVQFANPAAANMFQQPMDSFLGHPLGQPILKNQLTQIEILRVNGKTGIAEITVGSGVWDGQVVSIVCLRDMSDRPQSSSYSHTRSSP